MHKNSVAPRFISFFVAPISSEDISAPHFVHLFCIYDLQAEHLTAMCGNLGAVKIVKYAEILVGPKVAYSQTPLSGDHQ